MIKNFNIFGSLQMFKTCIWAIFIIFLQPLLQAQEPIPHPNAVQIALNYIGKNFNELSLTQRDVSSVYVQDSYTTEHNSVTHVFIVQQFNGVDLYNGIINVNILPSGEVLYVGNRFMKDLAGAASASAVPPQLKPEDAIAKTCSDLKIPVTRAAWSMKEKKNDKEYIFDKNDISLHEIPVKLFYERVNETEVRLVWEVQIEGTNGQGAWSTRIDALTGDIVNKNAMTLNCTFEDHAFKRFDICEDDIVLNKKEEEIPAAVDVLGIVSSSYNVFALPVESPNHGSRTVVTDPADPVASPFGWHDTNGQDGAEYTITRGNNVHAYLDWNGRNTSQLDEPNGGADLVFNAPFLPNAEPDTNRQAATINLFYVNNMMHDISFRYGFNEAAGNFQFRNYTGTSGGNDHILAEAQDGAKLTESVNTRNNANFSITADGTSSRIQMFTWTRTGERLLHVTAPASIKEDIQVGTASFGLTIDTVKIGGDVVIVNDGSSQPTLGCNAPLNDVKGKVVIIDRGVCEFGVKSFNVQQKGAIGVIICNFEENLVLMGAGTTGSKVTIPVVSIKKSDCDRIRLSAGKDLKVSFYRDAVASGPNLLDGDFDNGIIAHEYGHGVSARLTGGRLNVNCLSSGEQASAEGWSDFLALAVTAKPTDKAVTPRGVGTYVYRQQTNGPGVRNNVYSSDLSVSPNTYDDIIRDEEVHSVGEIWVSPLWDLYWMFVDLYGFDSNLRNTNSGNGKMLKLAFDCMKMQPCNPGFLDGRDALIAADKANFGGQHECMIWSAFARRGMGFNAKQGLASKKDDNTEGFDIKPQCIQRLKITKSATESIKPGEQITYKVTVTNHKAAAATGVVVRDDLPTGTTYVSGSADRTVSVANGVLTWQIGSLAKDSSIILTYKVSTPTDKKSVAQFYDDFEIGDNNWDLEDLKGSGNIWENTDVFKRSGNKSQRVIYPTSAKSSDQILKTLNNINVKGTKPILRFYHRYNTQPGVDAGVVEVSTDNGNVWQRMDDKIFKNPYRGEVVYGTFVLPNMKAFWGRLDTFTPVCIDLSSYIGKDIKIRYRFSADSLSNNFTGWYIDDVAVMDMYNYNSTARVTSAQNDTASAEVPARGTIVDPTTLSASKEIKDDLNVKVFPNPTNDILNINISSKETNSAELSLYTTDGRALWRSKNNLIGGGESLIPVDVSTYAPGVYIVKIQTDQKVLIEKIIKN